MMASALVSAMLLSVMPAVPAQAIVKGNAITYEYYTRKLKNTVPASWLFVGTYLMSAKGLSAQMYMNLTE